MENTRTENTKSGKTITIKKSKAAIVREHVEKNNKMIRCQLQMYGVKGLKELPLTYTVSGNKIFKKVVKNNEIVELPFGYIKYLNEHGKVRVEKNTALVLQDENGNPKKVAEEDAEQRYSFKILDVLSSSEFEELDPTIIRRARLV